MAASMIGRVAPDFELPCVESDGAVVHRSLTSYRGRWLALVFYPRDFSFVCPTELVALSSRIEEFAGRNCDVLAVSVDSIESHAQWRSKAESDGGVSNLRFPLGSDVDGSLGKAYGVWMDEKGVSTRGLYLINPEGIVEYLVLHNLSVGRNIEEILRVLDGLQSGGLCPASWRNADGTIDIARALRPGRVLGHYRLVNELGAGAFGRVFSAWDLQLERHVALKILINGDERDRFLSEARAVAKIDHPNVCGIYAAEVNDGLAMIAMPLLTGGSLESRIGKLERREATRLGASIASGIAAAHAQSIVHGDLKPANILLDANDDPQIVDFGLAKIHRTMQFAGNDRPMRYRLEGRRFEETLSPDLQETDQWRLVPMEESDETSPDLVESQSGLAATWNQDASSISGTPAYMSPEQLLGEAAAPASDVYALGLILREMFCGRRHYRSLADLVKERVADVHLAKPLCEKYPRESRLVQLLLHRDPCARPTAAEAAEELSQLLEPTSVPIIV
ncbi:MAG: redoxin domain-containing protein [Pirellulales bacterium]